MKRLIVVLAVAGLAVSACSGPASPAAPAAPSPSRSVAVLPSVVAAGTGPYTEPCQRVVKMADPWLDVALRAVETDDPATDIPRPEVEALINQLAAVTPLLPPDVQPLMPDLVDPMVQLRGVILTGAEFTVDFGPGRDNWLTLFAACDKQFPRY